MLAPVVNSTETGSHPSLKPGGQEASDEVGSTVFAGDAKFPSKGPSLNVDVTALDGKLGVLDRTTTPSYHLIGRPLHIQDIKDFLEERPYADIVVELSMKALYRFFAITRKLPGLRFARLTLIVDHRSFSHPRRLNACLAEYLQVSIKRCRKLKQIVVKFRAAPASFKILHVYTVIAWALHGISSHRSSHNLRGIRLEIDGHFSKDHATALVQSWSSKHPMNGKRTWNMHWRDFHGLHIVQHPAPPDLVLPQSLYLPVWTRKLSEELHGVLANLCYSPVTARAWSYILDCEPRLPMVRVDKFQNNGFKIHATLVLAHQSTSWPETKRLLKPFERLSVPEPPQDMNESEKEVWNAQKPHFTIGRLAHLELTNLRHADAAPLIAVIEANNRSLVALHLGCALATGTWDQIFTALKSCPKLLMKRTSGSGLGYELGEGPRWTGYFRRSQEADGEVVRWKDWYALVDLERSGWKKEDPGSEAILKGGMTVLDYLLGEGVERERREWDERMWEEWTM